MKKIIALTLIAVIGIFAMVGCAKSGSGEDPVELALELDERGYYAEIIVDRQEIMDKGYDEEMDFDGVEAIVSVSSSPATVKIGVFAFCTSEDAAEAVESQFVEFSCTSEFREMIGKGAVDRNGTIVFIGSQELLEFVE